VDATAASADFAAVVEQTKSSLGAKGFGRQADLSGLAAGIKAEQQRVKEEKEEQQKQQDEQQQEKQRRWEAAGEGGAAGEAAEAGIEAQQRATAADAARAYDAQVRRQEEEEEGTSDSARHVIHRFINPRLLIQVTP